MYIFTCTFYAVSENKQVRLFSTYTFLCVVSNFFNCIFSLIQSYARAHLERKERKIKVDVKYFQVYILKHLQEVSLPGDALKCAPEITVH